MLLKCSWFSVLEDTDGAAPQQGFYRWLPQLGHALRTTYNLVTRPVVVTKILPFYHRDSRKSCSLQRHTSRTASVGRSQLRTAKNRRKLSKAWPWMFLYLVLSMLICVRDRLEHSLSVQMHTYCGLMYTTSSTYLHVPFPRPSARCVKHSAQFCSCQLPAGSSICFSLRMVRETCKHPIPSHISFHHIIYPTWPHFLIIYVLSKEKNFFF